MGIQMENDLQECLGLREAVSFLIVPRQKCEENPVK